MSLKNRSKIYLIVSVLLVGNLLSALTFVQATSTWLGSGDQVILFLTFLISGAVLLEFAWDTGDYVQNRGAFAFPFFRKILELAVVGLAALTFYTGVKQVLVEAYLGYLYVLLELTFLALAGFVGWCIYRNYSEFQQFIRSREVREQIRNYVFRVLDFLETIKDKVESFLGDSEDKVRRVESGSESRWLRLHFMDDFISAVEKGKDIRVAFAALTKCLHLIVGLVVVGGAGLVLARLINHLGISWNTTQVIDPLFGLTIGLAQGLIAVFLAVLAVYMYSATVRYRSRKVLGLEVERFTVFPTAGEIINYGVELLKLAGELSLVTGLLVASGSVIWAGVELLNALLAGVFQLNLIPFVPFNITYWGFSIVPVESYRAVGALLHLRMTGLILAFGSVFLVGTFLVRLGFYFLSEFFYVLIAIADSISQFLIDLDWSDLSSDY